MLQLEEALRRVLSEPPSVRSERLLLAEAEGRVLAESVRSSIDLPPFDNSSMDGYAVRAADTNGARPEKPARLRLKGRVAAGESFAGTVRGGECVRLFTGSPLPAGADAVVMQEETRLEDEFSEVSILGEVRPGENVRFRGEDVKCGAEVVQTGHEVTPGLLCLLSAAGVTRVRVGARPSLSVLPTGSELKEGGRELAPGQIYESNQLGLLALARRAGAVPVRSPVVADTPEATRSGLEQAFKTSDMVVTCGGVSVGELDFVKQAFEDLGGKLGFWKVAMKPGKPFVFGSLGKKLLFGLPGNPVSAMVTFLLLVRPAIRRWQGALDPGLPSVTAVAAEALENPGDRRHFIRVRLDPSGSVRATGLQASHILSSLAAANALVDVPPRTTWPAGASVKVLIF